MSIKSCSVYTVYYGLKESIIFLFDDLRKLFLLHLEEMSKTVKMIII